MKEQEYILCAAICNPNEKDMNGNSLIYCGHRHHNILWQGRYVSRKLEHQGFLTSTGRFVGRKEAFSVAADAGQLKKIAQNPIIGLFSEDLY